MGLKVIDASTGSDEANDGEGQQNTEGDDGIKSDPYKVNHDKSVSRSDKRGVAEMSIQEIGEMLGVVWEMKNAGNEQNETNSIVDERDQMQETKCGQIEEQWVEDIWGTRNFGFVQAAGDVGYVAVKGSWKGNDDEVILVSVYGPHPAAKKGELWKKLENLIDGCKVSWCVFGDFNEVRGQEDHLNTQFKVRESDEFNEFIAATLLMEVPLGHDLLGTVNMIGHIFVLFVHGHKQPPLSRVCYCYNNPPVAPSSS
ncbi:RNA-directed DNA polymerase, eukaryota [Artemisia annua]|uniref:RNA-directed DNA polymerase, eukaryota n=1 Tax=Artemisia annua TaxID=35608 RepID=A0A2U1PC19_ARTAN|nr:RNA-directed DNA polymerase, eukaryota [Artemisia annua]